MTDAGEAKRPLLVLQTAPYDGSLARSALDMAMSFAVFAQKPQVLFSGDGVLCLLAGQDPEELGRKSLRKVIDSFPLYDLEEIFVDGAALERNGASAELLPEFARVLDASALRDLHEQSSRIISL